MTEDKDAPGLIGTTMGNVFTLANPERQSITFHAGGHPILTMKPDGSIELGEGLSTDEATRAFCDCLANYLPGFLSALRQRLQRAEARAEALADDLRFE